MTLPGLVVKNVEQQPIGATVLIFPAPARPYTSERVSNEYCLTAKVKPFAGKVWLG